VAERHGQNREELKPKADLQKDNLLRHQTTHRLETT